MNGEQERQAGAGMVATGLVPHLLSVAKSARQLMQLALADLDVAVGQDSFLLAFAGQEARSVIDLAVALSVRPSTVSKMVDILEKKGWAARGRDEHDLRKVLVKLTPEGLETRSQVVKIRSSLETQLRKMANGEDAIDLSALRRLDETLSKRLSRRR
ncbi:hypothetical protein GCM10011390_37990 [Aureimonas endophytica]|uniref:HTH marR-type domain-containing protein n=1 Tax=Aureimonas endophytica TaxID=2027858 RepID=A0A916ZUV7_9HYPH|nr:MarR family transcriptional regulator [Aureimonas endophytica]GGE15276.1 hypothetical protein GCM10011390_37990 [Aureimonas endophytica]